MTKPFQRPSAQSNTQVGRDFETAVEKHFRKQNIYLHHHYPVEVGFSQKKQHRFDLASPEAGVLVECKSFTWTTGGNIPSAKIRNLNEAMLLFSVTPPTFHRKILVMLKHELNGRSLAQHYVSNHAHLIPPQTEIWEYDEKRKSASQLYPPPIS